MLGSCWSYESARRRDDLHSLKVFENASEEDVHEARGRSLSLGRCEQTRRGIAQTTGGSRDEACPKLKRQDFASVSIIFLRKDV